MYLDLNFLQQQLAVAVKNRKNIMRIILESEIEQNSDINIMNIACGSCREWYELLPSKNNSELKLTCIDHDQEALDMSKQRLEEISHKAEIAYVRDNVLKMALRKDNIQRYGLQDLIYSIGLYDYLSDKPLKKLLKAQYDLLKEGGKMVASFKDRDRYDRTRYEWICDWYFEQRREKDVFQIFEDIGIGKNQIKTSWEPSGVIAFFEITKE